MEMTVPQLRLIAEAVDKEKRQDLLVMSKVMSLSFGACMSEENGKTLEKLQDSLLESKVDLP